MYKWEFVPSIELAEVRASLKAEGSSARLRTLTMARLTAAGATAPAFLQRGLRRHTSDRGVQREKYVRRRYYDSPLRILDFPEKNSECIAPKRYSLVNSFER